MTDTDAVVRELLALDPSLKAREAQVRQAVSSMARGRPDTGFREEFRQGLRSRLDAEIARLSRPSAFARAVAAAWPFFAGAAAATFVAAALVRPDFLSRAPDRPIALAPVDGFSVVKREPGAFGPLAFLAPDGKESARAGFAASAAETAAAVSPKSVALAEAATDAVSLGVSADTAVSADAFVNAPSPSAVRAGKLVAAPVAQVVPLVPRFVLTGALEVPRDPLPVYRRLGVPASDGLAVAVVSALRANGLPAAAPAKLRSVTLVQAGSGGLLVTVDAAAGSVSAYRDWAAAPQCPPEGCAPLTAADLPSDAAVLSEAARTLSDLGISTKNYGSPAVVRPDAASGFTPDVLQVAYPMTVAGLPVVDQWGAPRVLTLDVDVRAMRVAALNGADVGAWASSEYPVLPVEKVVETAERGGLAYVAPVAGRFVEVPLGTPIRAYVAIVVPDGPDAGEYLVPALVVPVPAAPADVPVPAAVVVPLVAAPAR